MTLATLRADRPFARLATHTAAALEPVGVAERPVPEPFAARAGADGRVELTSRAWRVGPAAAPLADARFVRIVGAASEIVNCWLFPTDPARLPLFAAEMLVFGGTPRLAFLDLQWPGLRPDRRPAVTTGMRRLRRAFTDLVPPAADAPGWAVHDSSGFALYTRPDRQADAADRLVVAYGETLALWARLAAAASYDPPTTPDADAGDALARYKRMHLAESPGRDYLAKLFGADWTGRFLDEFLFA